MIRSIKPKQFLMVSIQPRDMSDEAHFLSLKELWRLVESYGGEVVEVVVQQREVYDKGPYIGMGKIKEVAELIVESQIEIVVFNAIIKPGQLHQMKTEFLRYRDPIETWDRVDLILQIFSQHAHTAEAKLQIELAMMRHMGPRIYGMGMELSRQGGGIGGRGIGETNTERMKRHWSGQMKKTQDQLDKMRMDRERQLDRRRRVGLKTVSLVGYTNAGKTSLYNALVGKGKLVDNKLFATLDASVGKLYLPKLGQAVLISDTIGFIQGLPPELVEAFRSTLLESVYADVLLQVIDVSDPNWEQQVQVVESILSDLGLKDQKRIYVFNKMDQKIEVDQQFVVNKYKAFNPQFVSVRNGIGIEQLLQQLTDEIATQK